MASQSQGIQQRRSELRRRCRRPTSESTEAGQEAAQAETEQYRLRREKEFKAKEAAALGSHGSCSTEVEKETEEMTLLQTYFRQNRDDVLDSLLKFICDIHPEIHENYRING